MNDLLSKASFRDPSGFIFSRGDKIYRQVNLQYKNDYEYLMSSGLYKALTDAQLLVPHEEVSIELAQSQVAYKILRPEPLPFISYPYEWCFTQFKNAAIATLEIQRTALKHGMILKDANPYNIQFLGSQAMMIDTLSFEKYVPGQVWAPYRQFCEGFLAPLALMSRRDVRLNCLLKTYHNGLPLDLVCKLLPGRMRFNTGLLFHIYFHSSSQRRADRKSIETIRNHKVGLQALYGLIDNLASCVNKLSWHTSEHKWGDYYSENMYSGDALASKKNIVAEYVGILRPNTVWDIGANTGLFSRIAAAGGAYTISCDNDPFCVEMNYREAVRNSESRLLPLIIDLANPSPGIGWVNQERASFTSRGPADTVLALAIVHHLAISNNVPFRLIAEYLSTMGRSLVIEFIPKEDPKVKLLLESRKDIFSEYTQDFFETEFERFFSIEKRDRINDSQRTLYLMSRLG